MYTISWNIPKEFKWVQLKGKTLLEDTNKSFSYSVIYSFFLFQTLHAILIAITGIKNSQSIHIKSNMDQILKW